MNDMDQQVDKVNALCFRLGRDPKFLPVTRNDVKAMTREVLDSAVPLDKETRQRYVNMSSSGILTPGEVHTFMGIQLKHY